MLKKPLLLVVLVCLGGYSYSNYYFGSTNNPVSNSLTWDMNNVLPDLYNLKVNGVFYTYTPIKNTADPMKVYVSNLNPNGGYTFRETDDWSGKPGGVAIRKAIGFEYIPKELWGDGSIEVDGSGSITNAQVVYTYRYEEGCSSPLDSPTCDGYADAVLDVIPDTIITNIYNALEDDNVDRDETEVDYKEEKQEQEEVKEEDDLERALAINEETLEFGSNLAQNQMLEAMNNAININTYINKTIDGGEYQDTQKIEGGRISDNPKGARMGLVSDYLHDKMVDMQYSRGEKND
jgi:hypothetical protein